jgi:hypothetical protein
MSSDSISKLSDCPPDVSSSPYSSSYELGKDDIDYFLGATLELTISFPSCHESFPVVAAVALVFTLSLSFNKTCLCRCRGRLQNVILFPCTGFHSCPVSMLQCKLWSTPPKRPTLLVWRNTCRPLWEQCRTQLSTCDGNKNHYS